MPYFTIQSVINHPTEKVEKIEKQKIKDNMVMLGTNIEEQNDFERLYRARNRCKLKG